LIKKLQFFGENMLKIITSVPGLTFLLGNEEMSYAESVLRQFSRQNSARLDVGLRVRIGQRQKPGNTTKKIKICK
jgi:hypothetical protein